MYSADRRERGLARQHGDRVLGGQHAPSRCASRSWPSPGAGSAPRSRARAAPARSPARARTRPGRRRRSCPPAAPRASAASSTTGPRAVLTRCAVGFIRPSRRASIRCRVASVSGQWIDTTSAVVEQLVELEPGGVELGLERGVGRAPAGVGDPHPERPRAPGRRRADLAEPDDPERLSLQARAEHEEHAPRPRPAGADQALGLAQPPRRRQDQREREVGGGVGQHAGRVGAHHPAGGARRHVDVVVADRDVRDHPQAGPGGVQEGVVDAVVQKRHHGVGPAHRRVQLVGAPAAGRAGRPTRRRPAPAARAPARGCGG